MHHPEVVIRVEALNQVQAQVQNPEAGVPEASVKVLHLPAVLRVHLEAAGAVGLEIARVLPAVVQLRDHLSQYQYLYQCLGTHITAATVEVQFFHHCSVLFC